MNRQVRLLGSDTWTDYGPVTIDFAARMFASLPMYQSFFDADKLVVEVRTEGSVMPVSQITVERTVEYRCTNLQTSQATKEARDV